LYNLLGVHTCTVTLDRPRGLFGHPHQVTIFRDLMTTCQFEIIVTSTLYRFGFKMLTHDLFCFFCRTGGNMTPSIGQRNANWAMGEENGSQIMLL